MVRNIVLLLSLLAAVACAPEPGSLRVDPERSLLSSTRGAATRIYAATGVTVQVGEGDAELRVDAYMAPAEDMKPNNWRECTESCEWAGIFSLDDKSIRISRDVASELREAITLHEILHALTLSHDHLEPGAGVMSDPGIGECLTEADVTYICDRIQCAWFTPEC